MTLLFGCFGTECPPYQAHERVLQQPPPFRKCPS